jgi:hypothetical protein
MFERGYVPDAILGTGAPNHAGRGQFVELGLL